MVKVDSSRSFSQVYKQLNPNQKKAVDSIDGPVMVLAGPGTGKTQVLAARIANILLKTDTNPTSILALTFTESAAKNMRQRLVSMIGKTGYYVQVDTFHSFCSTVIQTHPEYFPIARGSEPLSDLERYDLFQSIISDLKLDVLKPINQPLFYVREIISSISDLKREGATIEDFFAVVAHEETEVCDLAKQREESTSRKKVITKTELARKEKQLRKNQELSQIYQEYEKRLRKALRYDFDDMISLVVSAFRQHQELLREYQENLHYFLVDEYQDTNTAQNMIVELLASYWKEDANVFVVGDPNQAIYRFQGASIENALRFESVYPKAEVINLTIGYRCTQQVYDAAAAVISHNNLDLQNQKKETLLHSPKQEGKQISVYEAPSQTIELLYVAEKITALIDKGIPADEIAVLFRHNKDVVELQEILDKWGVLYEIDGGDDVLLNESIRQLLLLLTVVNAIAQGEEEDDLYQVMRYEWLGLNAFSVTKAARIAGKRKTSLYHVLTQGYESLSDQDESAKITQQEFTQLEKFLDTIKGWIILDAQKVFPEWFETVLQESGFLSWIMNQPNKLDLLNHINSLYRQIKSLAQSQPGMKLVTFLQAIDTMQEHGISVQTEDLNVRKDAVHLSTVHKAKGQEWSFVFIIHCLDKKWGNNRKRELIKLPESLLKNTDISKKELNEDERRLFYVALTRAKTEVIISYPETILTDNRSKDVVESMFLQEIPQKTMLDDPSLPNTLEDRLLKLIALPTKEKDRFEIKEDEAAFYTSILNSFQLSVTALNTYLRDPQEFVENNLLRLPRSKPEHMAYGTAIHFSLEKLYKYVQQHRQKPPLSFVFDYYQQSLERELLTSSDFDRRLKHGQEVLEQYYQQQLPSSERIVFVERFFGSGWSKAYLGNIALTGRIDRVDWVDSGKKTVKVIDYKTGKVKSKNVIEGKVASMELSDRERSLPESVRGPYKRQLLFYKLLCQLDKTFTPMVIQGEFDFVEPNKSGKLVKRVFDLPDKDVDDLKNLIIEIMDEINNLKFLEAIYLQESNAK